MVIYNMINIIIRISCTNTFPPEQTHSRAAIYEQIKEFTQKKTTTNFLNKFKSAINLTLKRGQFHVQTAKGC